MANNMKRRTAVLAVTCVTAVFGLAGRNANAENKASEDPVRSFSVSIAKDTRDRFFACLAAFAKRNAFSIQIYPKSPDGRLILVQMLRRDLEILINNPFDPLTFRVNLFRSGAAPIVEGLADKIVADLKTEVSMMPGVVFYQK
jgi:hypothetical protein